MAIAVLAGWREMCDECDSLHRHACRHGIYRCLFGLFVHIDLGLPLREMKGCSTWTDRVLRLIYILFNPSIASWHRVKYIYHGLVGGLAKSNLRALNIYYVSKQMYNGLCRMLRDWKYGFLTKTTAQYSKELSGHCKDPDLLWKVWLQHFACELRYYAYCHSLNKEC